MKTSQLDGSIRALIAEAEYALAQGPHPERARLDAESLLLHVVRAAEPERNRAWLVAYSNSPVAPGIATALQALVERRLVGEPIQYITGETEFYGLPFRVTRDVLVPRRETEHLVEWVLDLASRFAAPRIVDVGTGSGAIAVALAYKLQNAQFTAIDLSDAALAVARENAERNSVAGRVRFLRGDLLVPVAEERFDLVVSNPPYVPAIDRDSLAVEVRDYEPALALFAGDDGLEVYRRLIPTAHAALAPGGFVALEIGFGQSEAVETLLADTGFTHIECTCDLQGIPRVAIAQRAHAGLVPEYNDPHDRAAAG
jgi:release factor glutamine methyltransferase